MNRQLIGMALSLGVGSPLFAAEPADISSDLANLLADSHVPALSMAVVVDGRIVAAGAAGIRKAGRINVSLPGDFTNI